MPHSGYTICTSEQRPTSTSVSQGFVVVRYSSPPFGSHGPCKHSKPCPLDTGTGVPCRAEPFLIARRMWSPPGKTGGGTVSNQQLELHRGSGPGPRGMDTLRGRVAPPFVHTHMICQADDSCFQAVPGRRSQEPERNFQDGSTATVSHMPRPEATEGPSTHNPGPRIGLIVDQQHTLQCVAFGVATGPRRTSVLLESPPPATHSPCTSERFHQPFARVDQPCHLLPGPGSVPILSGEATHHLGRRSLSPCPCGLSLRTPANLQAP